MLLKVFTPPPPLGLFVKNLIYYRGYTSEATFEQLIPDGHAQLVITLDEQARMLKQATEYTNQKLPPVWLSGVQSGPITYVGEQNASTLCVQFAPGGLYALTGIPTAKFHNRFEDASLVLGPELIYLREQMMALSNPAAIIQQAYEFLQQKILTNATDNYFETFVHQLLCIKRDTLAEISRKTGYSQRYFIQLFKQHMGIAPKKYQRLHRFQQALAHLNQTPQASFADLVYQCHFYDQAHFINEFKHFTQLTPGQYLSAERPYAHVIATEEMA
ncbi:MAG TPA: hypothetical protein DCS93_22790 [Microscillaceae bacterium]|nr:hypothetical protein [Microscillaceae bacterium]